MTSIVTPRPWLISDLDPYLTKKVNSQLNRLGRQSLDPVNHDQSFIVNKRLKRIFAHHGSYPKQIIENLMRGSLGMIVVVSKGFRIKKELKEIIVDGDKFNEDGFREQTRIGKIVVISKMVAVQEVDIVRLKNAHIKFFSPSEETEFNSLETVTSMEECIKMITNLPQTWMKLNVGSIIPKYSYLRVFENVLIAPNFFVGKMRDLSINEDFALLAPVIRNPSQTTLNRNELSPWKKFEQEWNENQKLNEITPLDQSKYCEMYRLYREFANQVDVSRIVAKTPQGLSATFYVAGTFVGEFACDALTFSNVVQSLALLAVTQVPETLSPFLQSDLSTSVNKKYRLTMSRAKPGKALWVQEVDAVSMMKFRFSWKTGLIVIGNKGSMKSTVIDLLKQVPGYDSAYKWADSDDYWKWVTHRKWESKEDSDKQEFERAVARVKHLGSEKTINSLVKSILAEGPYYTVKIMSADFTHRNPLLQNDPSKFAQLARELNSIMESDNYGYTKYAMDQPDYDDDKQRFSFVHSSMEATYLNPMDQQIKILPSIASRWRLQQTHRPNKVIEQWAHEVFNVMDQRQCNSSWIDFLFLAAPEALKVLYSNLNQTLNSGVKNVEVVEPFC